MAPLLYYILIAGDKQLILHITPWAALSPKHSRQTEGGGVAVKGE
jgi:hypothetical protein